MIEIRARIAGPFSPLKGMPATVADPEVGAISVPSVRKGGRLARPVWAEEAEHLAMANLERNVIERDAITEALTQVLDHQRGPIDRPVEGRSTTCGYSTTKRLRSRLGCHRRSPAPRQRTGDAAEPAKAGSPSELQLVASPIPASQPPPGR